MATKTIGTGGDYTTIQAWINSIPATLTEPEVGRLLNQTFNLGGGQSLDFSGKTTTATNTITLECNPGASFVDHASKLTNPLRPSSTYGALISSDVVGINISLGSTAYVTFRNLQIDWQSYGGFISASSATNFTIDNCIFRVYYNGAVDMRGNGSVIRNSLFIFRGAEANESTPNGMIYLGTTGGGNSSAINCTVLRPAGASAMAAGSAGIGIASSGGATIKNCAVFGFPVAVSNLGSATSDSDYNATDATSIGTGQGTHNLVSQSFTNSFQDTGSTVANIDGRLKSGSPLIDAGVTVSGITTDIVGKTRSTFDIGAWEVVSVDTTGPTVTSASINGAGTTLTIVTNENATAGAGGNGGFALTASGGAVTLTYSAGSGTSSLTYTTSRTILSNETLTLAYTQPGNGWEDSLGNDMLTFTGTNVTNGSSQTTDFTAGLASFVPAGISVSAVAPTNGTGSGPTYQWERRTNGTGSYTDLTGATTLSWTDTTAVAGNYYEYRCKQTRGAETVTTNVITAQVYTGGIIGSGGPTYSAF